MDPCLLTGNVPEFPPVHMMLHGTQEFRFKVEPGDAVVLTGRPITLNCQIEVPDDFYEEVFIRWRGEDDSSYFSERDPKRILHTNGSLSIPYATLDEQGVYQCVVTVGSIGLMASRRAKVQVASLTPSLDTQPQDLRVFPHQTAHFSCAMNGPLKYSVTWLKDDRPLILDPSRMVLMPSGSLEIDKVEATDQGSYRCNASSSGINKLSNKAVLTMDTDSNASSNIKAPIFITKPKSVTVREGETIVLDCAANGYPRPWLLWLKDGVAIDMAEVNGRVSKLGSGSLQIINATEKDSGVYQCRAENLEDSVDAPTTVQVQVPPRFQKVPQDTIAYEKQDLELGCQAYGKPEPRIQWLKNGELIKVNDYIQFVNGYNLKILGLMKMDAGIFQCVAFNAAGNIQTAARLTVLQTENEQVFSSKDRGASKSEGGKRLPFPLKADDDDYEALSEDYEDFENDLEDIESSEPLHVNITNSLEDKSSEKHASHPFEKSPQHVSSNNLGTSATDLPTIGLVPSPPRAVEAIFISSRSVTLRLQPPTQTNGDITSYSVFFRQDGSQRERVLNTSGVRSDEITVPGLQPDRTYHIRVVANNAHGASASSDNLEVRTETEVHVPSAPLGITAYATSPTSIIVEWKPPAVTNGPILRYKLIFLESDSSNENHVMTAGLSTEVSELNKFTEYCFWVIAVNENGLGSASEEVIVRTLSDVPSDPPQNVTVEAGSSTSVVVRWEPPPKDGQNGIITGYKLRYKKQNRRDRGDRGYTVTAAGDRRLYVLSDLHKGSLYQVRIWAMNVNGTGPPTDWIPVETFDNDLDETHVPDKPTNLIARPSSNSIRVSWSPPKDPNIMVRGYSIGWGKGFPYTFSETLDGKQRSFNIENLELNSEYVIAVRPYNSLGDGLPAYVSVRTREEPPPEDQITILPPVGLKAVVLSSSSAILHWTDPTRGQVPDERIYSVKYSWAHHSNPRPKYVNTTDSNCMINDLRPNTQYEFSVKLIKGRRESKWSMVVFNTTFEAIPSSAPRDLTVVPVEKNPTHVNLNWQPPKQANGQITGYVIFYTTDYEAPEKDWIPQNIVGDKLTAVIKGLNPSTTYYFKIQARNSKGYGPLSTRVSFKTGDGPAPSSESTLFGKDERPLSKVIYIILACSLAAVLCVALTIGVICCRRASARHRNASGYLKGNLKPKTNMKPPDLWIHHDQMELKALEKAHHSNSDIGPSGSGTLGRNGSGHIPNDLDHTNSLDKRTYLPSYVGSNSASNQEKTSTIKRMVKPKPISLPMESPPIAQPVMTTTTIPPQSPGSELGRPLYPRTQYRAHIGLDSSGSTLDNPYSLQSGYDSIGSVTPTAAILPNSTYSSGNGPLPPSTGLNTLASQSSLQPGLASSCITNTEGNGTLGKRQQGHPLKSFSVPAPPPQSAPGTPQQKHIVRPLQGSSPYKKPGSHCLTGTGSPSNTKLRSGPGTVEETTRLQPSYSTEELNQEMANLEGLMKDLNAITASEFEC
ncbi:hypothetical protein RUM43_014202 [Polyplax serrata]|uniref:Neogenin n=1 Tax=Polyplax serrata TaxID=468196 RepID=A0AAN8NZN3_POLSC